MGRWTPLSVGVVTCALASTSFARADEAHGWIADARVGAPILESGAVELVASGQLGYRWERLELTASGGIDQYASASDNVFNNTTRAGWHLHGAYVSGEPGDRVRWLVEQDLAHTAYLTRYLELSSSTDGDLLDFNLDIKHEDSHMLRGSTLVGLLYEAPRSQARVTLGLGGQGELYLMTMFQNDDMGTAAAFEADLQLSLRQQAHLRARHELVPGKLALRVLSDTTTFRISRSSAAVKIDFSSFSEIVTRKTSAASSILTRVARDVLGPLGLRQKGRSRIWIDDRGWWLIVVEFQPSSWSQGSYLNVAGMWLWTRADYFHFDTADSRMSEHVQFRDEVQFEPAARRLAELAAGRVRELRERFASPEAAAEQLRTVEIEGGWPAYHAGVAAGLTGDVARARAAFKGLASTEDSDSPDWHRDLCRLAAELRNRCVDRAAFRAWASGVVAESRALLKLPALTSPAFS